MDIQQLKGPVILSLLIYHMAGCFPLSLYTSLSRFPWFTGFSIIGLPNVKSEGIKFAEMITIDVEDSASPSLQTKSFSWGRGNWEPHGREACLPKEFDTMQSLVFTTHFLYRNGMVVTAGRSNSVHLKKRK